MLLIKKRASQLTSPGELSNWCTGRNGLTASKYPRLPIKQPVTWLDL